MPYVLGGLGNMALAVELPHVKYNVQHSVRQGDLGFYRPFSLQKAVQRW